MSWQVVRLFLGLLCVDGHGYDERVGFLTDAGSVRLEIEDYVRSYRDPPRLVSCLIE